MRRGTFGAVVTALFLAAATAFAQPRPVIERIEPTSGPPGVEVQVIGRGFGTTGRIKLGSADCEVLRRLPARWTIRIPADAQSGNVVLETDAGSFRGPYFRVVAALPAPVIEGIAPTSGAPGTE